MGRERLTAGSWFLHSAFGFNVGFVRRHHGIVFGQDLNSFLDFRAIPHAKPSCGADLWGVDPIREMLEIYL